MQKEEALKKTRILFWGQAIVAALLIVLFESGLINRENIEMAPGTQYIIEVAGVMLTLILIPLAIKGFSAQMARATKNKIPHFINYYYNKSNARTSILFIVVMMNTVLYYSLGNNSSFYCGLLGIAAAIYSYPTKATLNNYDTNKQSKE